MAEFTPPEEASMRVALLGGGTIARLVLQHVRGGEFPGVEIVAVAGRTSSSRGRALAREFGVSYVAGRGRVGGGGAAGRSRSCFARRRSRTSRGPARGGNPRGRTLRRGARR